MGTPISFILDHVVVRRRRRGGLLSRLVPDGIASRARLARLQIGPATMAPAEIGPAAVAPAAAAPVNPAASPAADAVGRRSVWLPDGDDAPAPVALRDDADLPEPVALRDEADPPEHVAYVNGDGAPELVALPETEPGRAPLPPDEPAPIGPDDVPSARTTTSKWLPEELPPIAPEPEAAAARALHGDRPAPVLDTAHITRAVDAYCGELLGPAAGAEAAETIISRVHSASARSAATFDELLRLTRKTAAAYALAPGGWQGLVPADPESECRATPARIAARDSGGLSAATRVEFDAHLDHCLGCRAIELRVARAERAFVATLEDTSENDRDAGPSEAPAAAERPRRRAFFGSGQALLAVGACAAIAVAAVVLLLSGGHSPSAVQAAATSTPAPVSTRGVKPRAKTAAHHARAHRHRARTPARHARPRSKRHARPVRAGTSSAPAGSSVPSSGGGSSPSPAVGSGSPGASSSGSTGSSGASSSGGSSVSVSQQGSSLPAQSAPTQGIGSGGSSGSQH